MKKKKILLISLIMIVLLMKFIIIMRIKIMKSQKNELNEIVKKVCKLASDEGLPSAWKDFNNLVFSAIKEYESEKLNKAR